MAAHSCPRPLAFKAGGAIVKGHAVKLSADDTVVECTANTDNAIGIAMNDVSSAQATAGADVEVALPGGGYKAVLGESVTRGLHLVPHTDGTLVKSNASGDNVIAVAMASGSSGELIPVEVIHCIAVGADE